MMHRTSEFQSRRYFQSSVSRYRPSEPSAPRPALIMTIWRTVVIVLAGILCIASCSRASDQPKKKAPSTRDEQAVLIHLDPANEPDGKLTRTGLADLED